jgi:hypothetical protein
LTIEEVTGTLRAADEVDTPPPPPSPQVSGGKLLLTEEQWLDRYKQKDGDSGRGGASSGGRGKRRGKPRARGGKGASEGRSNSNRASSDDECKRCGKKGHWAQDCRGKLKVKGEAYAAQEDEATLMFAYGAMDESGPAVELPNSTTLPLALDGIDVFLASPPPTRVEIVEAKVFAATDVSEDRDLKRWVLDTGATNHMTGFRDTFSDLDTGIVGTVCFGDGSVIRIEGRGTILFSCKNGEHRTLRNVYFIPRLTTNIISVGQLDEVGFKVLIEEGMMRVFDEERHLLAKVHRGPSRLYVLEVTIARPVCWAVHAKERRLAVARPLRACQLRCAQEDGQGGAGARDAVVGSARPAVRRLPGREAQADSISSACPRALHRSPPTPPRRPLRTDLASNTQW